MKNKKQKIELIKSLKFTCPECKSHLIEDVTADVTLYSRILTINEDGDFEYDLIDQSDGELSHYQCSDCGWIVVDGTGLKITDCLELVKWLKSQRKKKK